MILFNLLNQKLVELVYQNDNKVKTMNGERFIIRPDETSSSEYVIFDVLEQKPIARGLTAEEARISKEYRNQEWQNQIKNYT